MKIAIPEYQGRVAPVFDTCRRILIFKWDESRADLILEQDWSTASRRGKVFRLKKMEVDVLLCGAISSEIEDWVYALGISLVAWLAGDVPTILKAYGDGCVMRPEYAMPGTRVCRRSRQRRQGYQVNIQRNQNATLNPKEKK
jgi:predicted Fe-Mo cluster-binding NifX family protein